jgi:hypothetical protein
MLQLQKSKKRIQIESRKGKRCIFNTALLCQEGFCSTCMIAMYSKKES